MLIFVGKIPGFLYIHSKELRQKYGTQKYLGVDLGVCIKY
jgi:hypothetical protein